MSNQDDPTPLNAEEVLDETVPGVSAAPDADTETPEAQPTPEDAPTVEVPKVEAETSAETTKLAEYMDALQRSRAEFANYKKRVTRELEDSQQKGAMNAIAQLLPVIDDLERALNSIPEELAEHPWMRGTALLLPKLHKTLTDLGIEAIDPTGQPFDPSQHEAIGMDDNSDVESGHVTMTLQKGYTSGDKILRPALVRVAS